MGRRTFWWNALFVATFSGLSLLPCSMPPLLKAIASADEKPVAGEETSEEVSFQREILPIFRAQCLGCHQPAKAMGGYNMVDVARLMAGGESGEAAIVAHQPDASKLLDEITPVNGQASMPQDRPPLRDAEIALIRKWIEQGAKMEAVSSPPIYSLESPPLYARPPVITSLDFSPNGQRLAVTGFHEVLVFDTSSWQRVSRWIGISPRVESLRYSHDGNRVAVTAGRPGLAGEVQVWDASEGRLLLSEATGFDTLFGVSWSPDDRLIAFGATDNIVRAIDSKSGERKLFQGAHEDWPRATVFTASGEHLITTGRDMTVKLTEVATERFIDNITSITPGALRGGQNAIARHPARDEVLVGGADGSPKLYRVFRQTARQIGDDANLVRKMADMPGRIFAVAISPDAKYFAAASTLDQQSQVRVWRYDIPEKMPEEIKAIQAKPATNRTAEEKQKLDRYVLDEPLAVATWDVPHTAIYSLSLDSHGRLAAGGSDGSIHVWDCNTQQPIIAFNAAPQEQAASQVARDLTAIRQQALASLEADRSNPSAKTDAALASALHPPCDYESLARLEVLPASIDLSQWHHYAQVVVRGVDASGREYDLTRFAKFTVSDDRLVIDRSGLVQGRSLGESSLRVQVGKLEQVIPVRVSQVDVSQVDFIQDVAPVLSRLGCNQGTCHGSAAGKNGFKLSLRGYDPVFDLRALTDDLAARRINLAAPHESLTLTKPLGEVPHQGGMLMKGGDRSSLVLERWIQQGATWNPGVAKVVKLEMAPRDPVVQMPGELRQMRIMATFADGSMRDVTREAFLESGSSEVAVVQDGASVMTVRRGEAPLLARYEGAYAATTLTVMGDRDQFTWNEPVAWNKIDELVSLKWKRMKIAPSNVCSDAEFLRRVYLDLVGLPPTAEQVRAFIYDPRETQAKRNAIIEQLLASEEYVDHWTNKWSDLLQVNSKFLGKEGAAAFKDWIRQQIAGNVPYDQFARKIMTASGSNKENPAASYFKILRTPEEILENSTHLFLAVRFNCNKCHDHPFERWTQDQYYQTAAFFSQVGLQKDEASGDKTIGGTAVEGAKPLYEVISDTGTGEMKHQRTAKEVAPMFPFDSSHATSDTASRRERFAAWMTSPENPYFAKSYVNRLWGYMLGTGLIEPLDDIRAGNPPSNPELLALLENEFRTHHFDVKHLLRMICQSRTYQLSIETNDWNRDDDRNYSHAKARRLPAEVLYDAIHRVTGTRTKLPGLAEGARAASLADADAGLPDGFLNNLGRPVRESACECERSSELQLGSVMALVSGPTIGSAIAESQNELHRLVASQTDPRAIVSEIFYRVLNRPATDSELDIAVKVFDQVIRDHERLEKLLEAKEAWWATERPQRETQRLQALEETKRSIEAREVEIKPERERMEAERQQRIAEAEASRKAYQDALPNKLQEAWAPRLNGVEWVPLVLLQGQSSNGATLIPQGDRSVLASGNAEKAIYTLDYATKQNRLTGLRLEALEVPSSEGGGPGLSKNGNFVITELELLAGPADDPSKWQPIKIKSADADYSQSGFSAAALFDGKKDDQGGWAIHDVGGSEHWVVLRFDQPLEIPAGWRLQVRMHQMHNAIDHRLGRFRVSITSHAEEIPLGLSENFEALVRTPAANRPESSQAAALKYFKKVDPGLKEEEQKVANASKPLAEDATLVELRKKLERLGKETPLDAALARLREDVQQSQLQLKDARTTAAEDLTWALINSPAFLFNH